MFDSLMTVRTELEAIASAFDAACLGADDSAEFVRQLGVVQRLLDGVLAKAAARVERTRGFEASGSRDAAHFVSRAVGIDTRDARRAIEVGDRLRDLPNTDAFMRLGGMSV